MELATDDRSLLLYDMISNYEEYQHTLKHCVAEAVPEDCSVIVADNSLFSLEEIGNRHILPFLEDGGLFNGAPKDDDHAIAETERMRSEGASFMMIARPAFCWLDYYAGFCQHLCDSYPLLACRPNSGHILCVVFDLRQSRSQEFISPWRMVRADQIKYLMNLVPEERLKEVYRKAVDFINLKTSSQTMGDYFEFGVYAGTSISIMHSIFQELGLVNLKLFGFDSFEGLPEETTKENVGWKPGQYACDLGTTKKFLSERGINTDRIRLIKGWFRNTLNHRTINNHRMTKASVILIDCDIYSSTVEVLRFCEALIQGHAIVFFDDWHSCGLANRNQGQKRAFDEFLAANAQFSATDFESYSPNAAAFHVMRN